MTLVVVGTLLALATAAWDGVDRDAPSLSLVDLATYRAALEGKPAGPALPATFRDLWDRPAEFRGRRVRVEGRVARRFRQGALGTFPPLVEAWTVSPAGDPLCLVFPDGKAAEAVRPGARVRFDGAFLRTVRYRGGDADRLAPLIVGDRPPTVIEPPAPAARGPVVPDAWNGFAPRDWALGLVAAAAVALYLARQHLSAPAPTSRRRRRELDDDGTPPKFLDAPYDEPSGPTFNEGSPRP